MKCTMLKENLHCLGQHIQLIGVEGGDSCGISVNQGVNLLSPMNPVFT